jgi:1-deoxy-D-xylulose 5-phosphate reductoisomerase
VAAEAFLEGAIRWLDIPGVIEESLAGWEGTPARTVEDVMEADSTARQRARVAVERRAMVA